MDLIKERYYQHNKLPHYDLNNKCQFITIRLFDSLPKKELGQIKKELDLSNKFQRQVLQKKILKFEDQGYGVCFLSDPRISEELIKIIFKHNLVLYQLVCWCIMPNHLHLILKPKIELGRIMRIIKNQSAFNANKILNRRGQFWMKDYFDRFIRDDEHFRLTIDYILNNPVKAGLIKKAEEWSWSGFLNL